jgi:hypothetical protein
LINIKIFETAGFCLVTIAATKHQAADLTFCQCFAQFAHCTVLLFFVFTMDRDMLQVLFIESIIVAVEDLLLIQDLVQAILRIFQTFFPANMQSITFAG